MCFVCYTRDLNMLLHKATHFKITKEINISKLYHETCKNQDYIVYLNYYKNKTKIKSKLLFRPC